MSGLESQVMLSERYETTSGEESGEVVEEERSALIGEV